MEQAKQIYRLDGLHCANCAAKIESQVSKLAGVANTRLDLATARLTFHTDGEINKEFSTDKEVRKIVKKIEPSVQVVDLSANTKKEHAHEHRKSKSGIIIFFVSVAILAVSFIPVLPEAAVLIIRISAALLAGYHTYISGVKTLFKLRMDESTLMTIAVVAAFIIGESFEAAMVIILFNLGELLEASAAGRSRKEIEKLAEIRPDSANIKKGGDIISVLAADVTAGTEIIVRPYERVPLDSIVLSGSSTFDTSALTGESLPTEAEAGTKVLSGSLNGSGMLTLRTTESYAQSAASRIISMVEDAAGRKGKAEQFITRFARVYTPIVSLLALLLALIPPLLFGGGFTDWIYRALVFLVASCPCALVISVPLAFFAGVGAASKRGVLIKGGRFEEVLASARAIVFDKTGTLTTGKLKVISVTVADGYTEDQVRQFAGTAEVNSTHPIAKAIWEDSGKPSSKGEYLEDAGFGVCNIVDGKTVRCGSAKLMDKYNIDTSAMDSQSVYVAVDGILAGGIMLADTPREGIRETMDELRALGIEKLHMLSGDNEREAAYVANHCGLDGYDAGLLPGDKVERLLQIKSDVSPVLFVGDGINDAPVLAAADAGVAMGLGSDAALEAADIILTGDRLNRLANGIRISRKVKRTARFNIVFALSVKAAVLILAAVGFAPMIAAVFADVGVSLISVFNSSFILMNNKK